MATTFKRVSKPSTDEINASLRDAENKLTTAEARVTALEDADIDLATDVTGVLPVANGGTGATTLTGLLTGNGTGAITGSVVGTVASAITTADFPKTNATNAAITGASVPVEAGGVYRFEFDAIVTPSAGGGEKYTMNGGTCTATHTEWSATIINASTAAIALTERESALGDQPNITTGSTLSIVRFCGSLTVNAGGTLQPTFAQNSASGTSTVLRGASLIATRVA